MVEYLKIPKERIGLLLEDEGKVLREIEARTATKIEVDKLNQIELDKLQVERMLCVCDVWNNCECDVILSANIPTYNRMQIENYIEIKSKAKCKFYYE